MSVEDSARTASSTAEWSDEDDAAGSMQHLLRAVQELSLARTLPEKTDGDGSEAAEKPFFERVKDIFG